MKTRIIIVSMLGILLLVAPVTNAQNENLVEVVATGIGVDENGALRNALRSAVENAVGMVIDAQTRIENSDIIEDNILTYSDGYVEDYKQTEEPKKGGDGLVRVTIKAQVKQTKLIEKIRAEKIAEKAVTGQHIYAQIVTQEEQQAAAAGIIGPEFEGIPSRLIEARPVGELRYDREKEVASIDVEISVSQEAYSAFVGRLLPKLESVCSKSIRVPVSEHKLSSDGKKLDKIKFANNIIVPDYSIFVCENINANLQSSRWTCFEVTQQIVQEITDNIDKYFVEVILEYKDMANFETCYIYPNARSDSKKFFGPVYLDNSGHRGRDYGIVPLMKKEYGMIYFSSSEISGGGFLLSLIVEASFPVSIDNLKEVSLVRTVVQSEAK